VAETHELARCDDTVELPSSSSIDSTEHLTVNPFASSDKINVQSVVAELQRRGGSVISFTSGSGPNDGTAPTCSEA
jgi:hypothetical protein